MSVRSDKCSDEYRSTLALAVFSVEQEKPTSRTKFNVSFEKKIENLWSQSKGLGWSYNDFVTRLLEVVMILRHRDSVKLAAASKRRFAAYIAKRNLGHQPLRQFLLC